MVGQTGSQFDWRKGCRLTELAWVSEPTVFSSKVFWRGFFEPEDLDQLKTAGGQGTPVWFGLVVDWELD